MRAVVVLLLPLGALAQATGPCTISGIACPYEHTDTDQDYTHIDSSDQWVWSGTTSDGRAWYESDDVDSSVKYLYYSTRAEGWLLTYTAPDLSADDPWVGNNNQVRFYSPEDDEANGDYPDGVFHGARLYCGHDTGNPAEGCSRHARGNGQYYYWCDNDGTVTVSCSGEPSPAPTVTAAPTITLAPTSTGWHVYNGNCYAALGTYAYWDDALEACEAYGGSLVSIADSEENDFVAGVCGDRVCWLGLREHPETDCDGASESCSNYYWVDGSGDLAWANWYEPWDAPNNYRGDDQEYAVMNALDCCCEDTWTNTLGDCCNLNGAWDDYPRSIDGWMRGAIHALCEVQDCAVGELDHVTGLDEQLECNGFDDEFDGVCSQAWCTSTDGHDGHDCMAGTPGERCTCSHGTARETGHVDYGCDGEDREDGEVHCYEYTCCTDGSGQGEECGDYWDDWGTIIFWWVFFMLMTVILAIISCAFSIVGLCNASKVGTSPPCCNSCSPGSLVSCNGLLIIIDFIALVFTGVLFGEVMHWIGLFAICFIFEMIGYIIMIILSAIAVLMLLSKKDKWGQEPMGPVVGAAIEMQPTQVRVQQGAITFDHKPQQGVILQGMPLQQPQQGVIVQGMPLQQAKTF